MSPEWWWWWWWCTGKTADTQSVSVVSGYVDLSCLLCFVRPAYELPYWSQGPPPVPALGLLMVLRVRTMFATVASIYWQNVLISQQNQESARDDLALNATDFELNRIEGNALVLYENWTFCLQLFLISTKLWWTFKHQLKQVADQRPSLGKKFPLQTRSFAWAGF